MNRRPLLRKVHLVNPSSPDGNLTSLVSVLVTFDKGGQETVACSECKSNRCEHCGVVFDSLVEEGVLRA